ncbi:MAG: TusE/DsrC/DsvC family sulfur relay protein [Natronospirillum sp.]|uniref:TusE/DsrC/DsvC family sulfur relay protein n=1 Tax=Natronospirillum sp. TaxID=2812955 RepID=UPI0025EEB958|nr:TusE/DsrC/DsvC family sulfur relay protein [Natronospirillum sp.]MCH8552393.1 TusE/DsrC/DsvC family sulfur relay protein [Natronospirillum sp.]
MVDTLHLHDEAFPLDQDGFLLDPARWSPELAHQIARTLVGIELEEAHWPVLELLRELYFNYDLAPANRQLVKVVRERLGEDKGSSIYLMTLFGGSPAKDAARIAGLPKPPHCL